ncbi:MAG: DUF5666 domain-containing protein [Mycobacteriaceae bacterium]
MSEDSTRRDPRLDSAQPPDSGAAHRRSGAPDAAPWPDPSQPLSGAAYAPNVSSPPYLPSAGMRPPRPASRSGLRTSLVAAVGVGLLVIGVGLGFGLGRATDSTAASATAGTAPTATVSGGTPGTGIQGGRPGSQGAGGSAQTSTGTIGAITAVNGATLTVQTTQGSSVTVTTTADTRVLSSAGNDVSALAVGEVVMVRGPVAADGSVSATIIIQSRLAYGSGPGGSASSSSRGTTPTGT